MIQDIFEYLPDAILVIRRNGRVEHANASALKLFGYERDELVGSLVEMLVPEQFRHLHNGNRNDYFDHPHIRPMGTGLDLSGVRKDGATIPVDITLGPFGDEHDLVVCAIRDMTSHKELIHAISEKNLELHNLAYYDHLTGLPNRGHLLQLLQQAIIDAERHGRLVAVFFLDVDRFKNINDSLGHAAGDELLKQITPRLSAAVRPGDTVARYGGDEFVIVLANVARVDDIGHLAQNVFAQFKLPFKIFDKELMITPSVGIALCPQDGKTPELLLKNADAALHHAKKSGRDNYKFFTSDLNMRIEKQLSLEMALHQAIKRQEFVLHYQPQVDLQSGVIVGVEALIRWRCNGALVSPLDFIPVAEDTGLIVAIGEWVTRTACTQAVTWKDAGLQPVSMSVNLSTRQLRDPDLINSVQEILLSTGIDPELLKFEITESALMLDPEKSGETLSQLSAMGVSMALDDFGTGYSNLSYIKNFPIDELKVDKSFVRDITIEPNDAVLTQAIINLAHSLGIKVVAEGVETIPQLAFLKLRGCDIIQGYLYAKPMPADELTNLLTENRRLDMLSIENDSPLRTLLIIDDEKNIRTALRRALRTEGYSIFEASNPTEALELLAKYSVGVVMCDQRLLAMSGVDFLSHVKKLYPETVRILLSGYADLESLTGAINKGAVYHFMMKPWDDDLLRQTLRDAFGQYSLNSSSVHKLMQDNSG
jgi:diguanylate cyclase (GGDEF)-like protein/PAS domain S-box-containing protein